MFFSSVFSIASVALRRDAPGSVWLPLARFFLTGKAAVCRLHDVCLTGYKCKAGWSGRSALASHVRWYDGLYYVWTQGPSRTSVVCAVATGAWNLSPSGGLTLAIRSPPPPRPRPVHGALERPQKPAGSHGKTRRAREVRLHLSCMARRPPCTRISFHLILGGAFLLPAMGRDHTLNYIILSAQASSVHVACLSKVCGLGRTLSTWLQQRGKIHIELCRCVARAVILTEAGMVGAEIIARTSLDCGTQ